MSGLLSLEEAWDRILALAPPTKSRVQSVLSGSVSQTLTRDIAALRTQPPADLSAMDGYAVASNGPWLRVGESRAGAPFAGRIEAGQCTRISTGAHVPHGADCILIQENAVISGNGVALAKGEVLPPKRTHVRKAGFDFSEGDTILKAGSRLSPGRIALAIAAGHSSLPVAIPPRVAVLDSGDELGNPDEPLAPHQIPASNGAMLAAMLDPYVRCVDRIGPVPDSAAALAAALENADDCNILVTSGGASVGDHDLVQQALKEWGAQLAFWKVAIKPGKPLIVATKQHDWGHQIILGLPGNPVSSFVTGFLFLLPLIRASIGDTNPLPRHEWRIAAEDLPATGLRREFLRGTSDGQKVKMAGSQDSSALIALARADCLIDRPAGADPVCAGERVPVYNLQNG